MGVGAGTVAAVSLAATAVSTAVGVMGSIQSANAQQANANYQAQVARNNAITAEQNARYAIQAGQSKALDESLKQRAKEGAIVSALAANGLDTDSGTPADIRETQKEIGTLSTQRTVDASQLAAYGYRTNATSFNAEAGLKSAQADQAGTAGGWSAAGGLLGGASSVASNYAKFQNAGIWQSSDNTASQPSSFMNIRSDASNRFTYG